MQQANSIDFDCQPMRTAHPAVDPCAQLIPQHYPFGGCYAIDASNRQGGNTTPKYAPRAQVDTGKKPLAPGIPRGPRTTEGCGKMAEFLAQAPWDEQREGLITTQSELGKHLNSHILYATA